MKLVGNEIYCLIKLARNIASAADWDCCPKKWYSRSLGFHDWRIEGKGIKVSTTGSTQHAGFNIKMSKTGSKKRFHVLCL